MISGSRGPLSVSKHGTSFLDSISSFCQAVTPHPSPTPEVFLVPPRLGTGDPLENFVPCSPRLHFCVFLRNVDTADKLRQSHAPHTPHTPNTPKRSYSAVLYEIAPQSVDIAYPGEKKTSHSTSSIPIRRSLSRRPTTKKSLVLPASAFLVNPIERPGL